ncbi:hypothetical protein RY27_02855 [Litorilinea aerophila]|nr:hypothetical protein RY27_02855 [Litorilinea aerophila]
MTSLGYREISAYVRGEMSLEEAMARMKVETHRFIRHQYTWFRKMPDVHWFDLEQEVESQIVALIEAFLAPGEGAS